MVGPGSADAVGLSVSEWASFGVDPPLLTGLGGVWGWGFLVVWLKEHGKALHRIKNSQLLNQPARAILFPYVSSPMFSCTSNTISIRKSFNSKMSARVPAIPYETLFINQAKKSKLLSLRKLKFS